jgi:hypothetical protein
MEKEKLKIKKLMVMSSNFYDKLLNQANDSNPEELVVKIFKSSKLSPAHKLSVFNNLIKILKAYHKLEFTSLQKDVTHSVLTQTDPELKDIQEKSELQDTRDDFLISNNNHSTPNKTSKEFTNKDLPTSESHFFESLSSEDDSRRTILSESLAEIIKKGAPSQKPVAQSKSVSTSFSNFNPIPNVARHSTSAIKENYFENIPEQNKKLSVTLPQNMELDVSEEKREFVDNLKEQLEEENISFKNFLVRNFDDGDRSFADLIDMRSNDMHAVKKPKSIINKQKEMRKISPLKRTRKQKGESQGFTSVPTYPRDYHPLNMIWKNYEDKSHRYNLNKQQI